MRKHGICIVLTYLPKDKTCVRSVIGFFTNNKLVTELKSGTPYELRFQNIIVNEKNKDCIKINPDCFLPIEMSILNPSTISDDTFINSNTTVVNPEKLDSLNNYEPPLVVKLYLQEYYTDNNKNVQNICGLDKDVNIVTVKGEFNFLVTFSNSTKNFQKFFVTLRSCVNSISQSFNSVLIFWLILGIFFGIISVAVILSLIKLGKS